MTASRTIPAMGSALARGRRGGAGLVVVSDMDGTITYNPEGRCAFIDDAMKTRIHPDVVAVFDRVHAYPNSRVVVSTGGAALRTKHIFEQSGLAVDAYCGYGQERVLVGPNGELNALPHLWSADLAPLWVEIADRLADELDVSYSTDGSAHDLGFVLEDKGTLVSFHVRNASQEKLGSLLTGEFVGGVVRQWAARHQSVLPKDLYEALAGGIHANPNHNAVVELNVPTKVDKGTVLRDVVSDYENSRGSSGGRGDRPMVVVCVDDEGDKPMIGAARDLRDLGFDAVSIAVKNPPHPTESKWRGTSPAILEMADLVVEARESSDGLLVPAQGVLADMFSQSLDLAAKIEQGTVARANSGLDTL